MSDQTSSTNDQTAAGDREALLVYIGQRTRLGEHNKIVYRAIYQEVIDGQVTGPELGWKKPLESIWSVGQVFRVTFGQGGNSVYTRGDKRPTFVETWHRKADLAAWSLADRESRIEEQRDRRAAREAVDGLADQLAPVTAAYRKARGSAARAAILAAVIETITGRY